MHLLFLNQETSLKHSTFIRIVQLTIKNSTTAALLFHEPSAMTVFHRFGLVVLRFQTFAK